MAASSFVERCILIAGGHTNNFCGGGACKLEEVAAYASRGASLKDTLAMAKATPFIAVDSVGGGSMDLGCTRFKPSKLRQQGLISEGDVFIQGEANITFDFSEKVSSNGNGRV